jgi:hypothetical protein
MIKISGEAARLLAKAGWTSGRRVPAPDTIPPTHPAAAVLESLSGFRIGETGPGLECAKSDLNFGLVDDGHKDIARLEALLGETLFGVAQVHNAHGELHIDGRGRCFGVSLMHSATWFEGETLDAALQGLLVGLRPRPILPPGEDSVELFGGTYRAGDDRLFDPAPNPQTQNAPAGPGPERPL